ncbi:MAG: methyltransferase, partial [Acholeplasmatales bacterium]|nr:methyltransferase [Acholeplasmatales bacterium]
MNNELLMCAYIRGYIKSKKLNIDKSLINKDLLLLDESDIKKLKEIGKANDLKLHYFKEKENLPRVDIVLGFLKNIYPKTLLDVGSGRGVFLFPLLKEFEDIKASSLDILDYRVELLKNIKDGGITNLNVYKSDICTFDAPNDSYEVVTLLEVLEHIPNVQSAVKNAVRISSKFIVVTVPSKPDDNPEHIHLLTKDILTKMFNDCGVANLKFGGVNGHLFLVARKK